MTIASEIERLQGAKADIRTSVEEKGVEIPTSATLDEYPEYIDQLSAGDVTNGAIQQFLSSGEDIEANTFVKFVANMPTDFTDVVLGNGWYSDSEIHALDKDRLLVVSRASSDSSVVNAAVVTVSNGVATVGGWTAVGGASSVAWKASSAGVLSPTKFILYDYPTNNTTNGGAVRVCSISDDGSITTGTPVTGLFVPRSVHVLNESRVILVGGSATPKYYTISIDGMACTQSASAMGENYQATPMYVVNKDHTGIIGTEFGNNYLCYQYLAGSTSVTRTTYTMFSSNGASYIKNGIIKRLSDKLAFFASYSTPDLYVATFVPAMVRNWTRRSSYMAVVSTGYESAVMQRPINIQTERVTGVWAMRVTDEAALLGYHYYTTPYLSMFRFTDHLIEGTTPVEGLIPSDEIIAGGAIGGGKIAILHGTSSNQLTLSIAKNDAITVEPSDANEADGLTKDLITSSTPGDVWVLA